VTVAVRADLPRPRSKRNQGRVDAQAVRSKAFRRIPAASSLAQAVTPTRPRTAPVFVGKRGGKVGSPLPIRGSACSLQRIRAMRSCE